MDALTVIQVAEDEFAVETVGTVRVGVAPAVVVGDRTLEPQNYGRVQDLAFVDASGQAVAWFAGGAGFGGGRVVIAPEREYRLVRSRNPLRTRMLLRDDDHHDLVAVHPRPDRTAILAFELLAPPPVAADLPLLLAVIAYSLVARDGIPTDIVTSEI